MEINEIRADSVESASPIADSKTSLEELQLENSRLHVELLRDVVDKRKKYPGRLYWLIVGWLIFIGALLFLQGFCGNESADQQCHQIYFHLDNSVLIAAIGGLTATVISMFIIIIRNLFPRHDGK